MAMRAVNGFLVSSWFAALFFASIAGLGGNWTNLGPPGSAIRAIAIDPKTPSVIFLGTDAGIFETGDGGASWSAMNSGLPTGQVTALAIATDPERTVYAGLLWVPAGPGSEASFIYKSVDSGVTWSLSLNPRATYVSSITIDPFVASTLYAGTTGGAFKSVDSGGSWIPINSGLNSSQVGPIVAAPAPSSTLYAATSRETGNSLSGGLFRSQDAGGHWELLGFEGSLSSGLAIDRRTPNTLYLVLVSDVSIGGMPPGTDIEKTTDGGRTWATVRGSIPPSVSIRRVSVGLTSVYAGTDAGVYRTLDGGTTWVAVNDGLTTLSVSALAVDPVSPNVVYAGTGDGGLFRRVFEQAGPCVADTASICLSNNRFRVQVAWRAENLGTSGVGQANPITSDTGAFWFFNPSNLELMIKVLDGRAINGKFWVFYGALSNVEYTITVIDTQTGAVKTYFNPQGQLASVADTSAF